MRRFILICWLAILTGIHCLEYKLGNVRVVMAAGLIPLILTTRTGQHSKERPSPAGALKSPRRICAERSGLQDKNNSQCGKSHRPQGAGESLSVGALSAGGLRRAKNSPIKTRPAAAWPPECLRANIPRSDAPQRAPAAQGKANGLIYFSKINGETGCFPRG